MVPKILLPMLAKVILLPSLELSLVILESLLLVGLEE